MPDTETLIATFGYMAIFLLMISNGLFSIPSSQILYIIVGYFIFTGSLAIFPASLAGAIGNTIGCILLYEGVRRWGIGFVAKQKLFSTVDLNKLEIAFRKRGLWFLFVGKLLPAIKVFVPIPAGLGKTDRLMFAGIMFAASWIWSFVFIAIGYTFGKSAQMWRSYGIALFIVAVIVAILFYRYFSRISPTYLVDDPAAKNDTPQDRE